MLCVFVCVCAILNQSTSKKSHFSNLMPVKRAVGVEIWGGGKQVWTKFEKGERQYRGEGWVFIKLVF